MAWTNILVAVDFSPNAVQALEEAVDLARKTAAQVTVVYVVPQVIFHPDWAADVEDTLDISDLTTAVQQELATLVEPYQGTGITITTHVLSGGPYVEIVRLARRLGADLIVIGAHGTAERRPALMGSVAEKVLREAPCSVLTIRPRS